ncbi:hypothetical protein [Edaphocola aurantiacus]|uniref:hypothetical protein n=1 Tax=Edaphocola aurantiacus TaxID=2601682 RepID=UPI001C94F8EB|nr:hypothetical protein [Edaphocola aurantiacus]
MERIHNLLRKIQDVYYQKGDKQVIDIDLMLDYTRVLYADLLEWRKATEDTAVTAPEWPAEPVMAAPTSEEQTVVQDAEPTAPEPTPVTEPIPVVTTTAPEVIPHEPEQAEEPEAEMPVAEETAEAETEVAVAETPEEVAPHVVDEVAEIATEEPVLPEEEEPVAEVQTMPEAEEEALKPVLEHMDEPIQSEIHLELPVTAEEQDLEPVILAEPEGERKSAPEHNTTSGYLFQKSFKDVRSFIGINDKYQFMNELFSNNKAAYETTLDKINFCSTLNEAEQWISNEARGQYNWSEEDETYQSLLTTVKKYFA